MKNADNTQRLSVIPVESPCRNRLASLKKLLTALCILLMTPVVTMAAHEKFVIDFQDSHIKGFRGDEATIFLKRSLKNQYPWVDIDRLDLKKVILVAKTRHGQGSASLRVGKWSTDMYRVEGSPRGFRDHDHRSFDKLRLSNPSHGSRGPWQIDLRGNFIVRKVILVVDSHRRKHHQPHHWYGHRW